MRREPVLLASLLTETRARAVVNSGQIIDRETWRQILGERIAQHSSPQAYRGRTLTVTVPSPVWAQELSFLTPVILSKLQAAGFPVAEIRWHVASLPPHGPPRTQAAPIVPLPKLPRDLEVAVSKVEDLELRQAIVEAAAHVMARQQRDAGIRPSTATLRDARVPQSAGPRTSRQAPNDSARHAKSRRTPAKPSG
jgi:hypothetical protein